MCVCVGGPASFLTIEQVRELDLGHGEKADYFSCKSTITFCKKDNCLYKVRKCLCVVCVSYSTRFPKACPSAECYKKVTEHDGQYTCEKCNQAFPNFKYQVILPVSLIPKPSFAYTKTLPILANPHSHTPML